MKLVGNRSEEHTSELQSLRHLVCRLLLEKNREHAKELRDYPPLEHERGTPTQLLAAQLLRKDTEGAESVELEDGALFFLMIRRPPRSTLFSLHDALPI